MIVAACDKPEAKPPTNIEKDEKADTDTDSEGESRGGSAGETGGESGSGSEGAKDTDGGEPADGDAGETGGESGGDGEDSTPAHSFAFDTASHKVAFTAGTYTKAVVETNKPAGDVRAIKYTSSENAIATVNDAGVVTFVTQGTVTITATKALKGEYPEATARYTLYITMKPTNKQALVDEITRATGAHGNEVDLNYIDVSAITDMNNLFNDHAKQGYGLQAFNGDISKWDVSKVITMASMFSGATSFNQDISKWKVSEVTNMRDMFSGATSFNQDISGWNVGEVQRDMQNMFRDATSFDKNLDAWEPRIHNAIKTDSWLGATNMFRGSGLANKLPSWCENTACKDRQS